MSDNVDNIQLTKRLLLQNTYTSTGRRSAGRMPYLLVLRNFVSTRNNALHVVSMVTAERSNEFCVFWTNATKSLLPSGLLGIPWSLCFRWSKLGGGKNPFTWDLKCTTVVIAISWDPNVAHVHEQILFLPAIFIYIYIYLCPWEIW